jgi:hypothetical protein
MISSFLQPLNCGGTSPTTLPRHPKTAPDEQQHFEATFNEQVRQTLEQRNPTDTRPLLVIASNENRFTGELSPCWCPPGFRPPVMRKALNQLDGEPERLRLIRNFHHIKTTL